MRKTLKRNLSYDDRNHLSYVSLYCDGEDGRRVRRTRTYPTMEQAEQVIAEYRRTQLFGGMSAPRDVFVEDWLRCSNDCIATGKGGGSRTPKYNPEGYVAVNEAGKPYQPDVLCQRIAQFIAAQGLPPISLHGLRHSFASVANR